MTRNAFNPPLNRQIVEEAAEWFVEINEGEADRATRQRFHAWLTLSPEHVRAYLELLPLWQDGAKLSPAAKDPQAWLEWARAETNVIPWATPTGVSTAASATVTTPPATKPETDAARAGSRRAGTAARVFAYALAASVLLVAAALLIWMQLFRGMYQAGIGEQRVIALEDGSQVDLNARSRLKVRFTDEERSVELISGQALFRVAKDKARPFVVRSGDASVRAVGTQFDVYRKSAGTIVTVVEGSVAVAPTKVPALAGNVAVLTAGQQIVVTSSTLPEPRLADVAIATAWTQQRLAFSRAPLAEVVEEFNRYNKRQLSIRDKALEDFRISGNFPSADPAPLLGFLRVQPGIRIHESGNTIEIALESQATVR